MSSPKKVAANRINGRKSHGPRTAAGKGRPSRDAHRHGLAAFGSNTPIMSDQIRQVVDTICDGDDDPLLREEAVAVAESRLWLACIGREKVAVLERLRDPSERSLMKRQTRAETRAKIDLRSRLKKAICRFMVVKIDKFYDSKPAVPPQG